MPFQRIKSKINEFKFERLKRQVLRDADERDCIYGELIPKSHVDRLRKIGILPEESRED